MSLDTQTTRNITINTLMRMKNEGNKISALTAYDYCSAYAASHANVEVLLVGDSLGMVIHGHDSNLSVTVEDIMYHIRCVKRGNIGSLLIADLPFMSYYSESQSLENAAKLMRSGAQMIKFEGGEWLAETTRLLSERGIPVCAHIGLTPQSIHYLGGYQIHGSKRHKRHQIIDDAIILQEAGARLILVECVPSYLGKLLTEILDVPVIGIGSGSGTDGQILVWHDLLGLYPGKKAKFAKNFLDGNQNGIQGALQDYVRSVKLGNYPDKEHSYD